MVVENINGPQRTYLSNEKMLKLLLKQKQRGTRMIACVGWPYNIEFRSSEP